MCYAGIRYEAHQRFDQASGAGIIYVYKATIKRLVRPHCVKTGLNILKRIEYF